MRLASAALLLLFATTVRAADPLDFVPAQALFVLKVENPRKLADAVTSLDAFKSASELTALMRRTESYDASVGAATYKSPSGDMAR